ncbi:hypothetical protein FSARC_5450 [Fusarium sarcochroum]|uniref:Carboxylesterase type B domain-containing protein n=1 Tax=Fusarium sarcochroum TaxID=1208366 RepID=A0A8H4X9I1_9HYPO|nr:hypothetical protein FSARC_5450 [Fusarium sarcochroum]
MAPLEPVGFTQAVLPTLGTVKGLVFPNGIRQFCGIPYAEFSKRWTRSTLKTRLSGGVHDGTQHGYVTPQPPEYQDLIGGLIPVEPFPHFKMHQQAEFDCLNLNIVLPPEDSSRPLPVMVFIHGGSFLMGASVHPAYDMVKFVSYSVKLGSPIVAVTISYRVGLFGFLASQAIKDDLSLGGYQGVGNFGLTDQQVALSWVQKYISAFNGNPNDVTIIGESAGGMSVAHHIWAAQPSVFHRAISLSGTLNTIPVWSLERHERRWNALLLHLNIDPLAPDALDKLRAVPYQVIAEATCVIEGTMGTTGNPCSDAWFHASPPASSRISSPPDWLKSYMVGDVRHEGMVFRMIVADETYESVKASMVKFLSDDEANTILELYDICPETPAGQVPFKLEEMATDSLFKVQNRIHASVSRIPKTFGFHLDQVSTFESPPFKGLAYHALDIGYAFLNLADNLTAAQQELGEKMAAGFIDFVWGKEPWPAYGRNKEWMIFGPDDKWGVKTEAEDESVRGYERMDKILDMGGEVLDRWVDAVDCLVNKRWLQKAA